MEASADRALGSRYREVKDPCPVHDGRRWHLYGTGITRDHQFEVLHATGPSLDGPWRLGHPVALAGLSGGCLAAPGVIADGSTHHMFLQTEYNVLGGRIEHVVSHDGGETFSHDGTALSSLARTAEAGIYDPHPAEIRGERYLVYSGFSVVGEPDLYLAHSPSGHWRGPWERRGPMLRHEEVGFHNQRGDKGYEWGLEGPQLLELPDGGVLLNAVCFLAEGRPGSRQRVFFGIAPEVGGRYALRGALMAPAGDRARGENGHASGVIDGDELVLFLQERDAGGEAWRYAVTRIPLAELVG